MREIASTELEHIVVATDVVCLPLRLRHERRQSPFLKAITLSSSLFQS
jgi:hypothetical protein